MTISTPDDIERELDEAEAPSNLTIPPESERDHTPVQLYTVRELQGIIRLTYRGTREWIRKYCTPIGGTVRVGRQLMVHTWAVNHALNRKTWTPEKMPKGRPLSRQRYRKDTT